MKIDHPIVIWQTAHLGDAVLVSALLNSFREMDPTISLKLVCRRGLSPLFDHWENLEVFEDDKTPLSAKKLVSEIRKIPTVFIHRSARTQMISTFFKTKAGFQILFGKNVPRGTWDGEHETQKNLRAGNALLARLNIPAPLKLAPPLLHLSETEIRSVPSTDIVLVPTSAWGTKEWPYFPELSQWLLKQGFKIKILGAKTAQDFPGCEDQRGIRPLRDLMAHIYNSKAVVGNDSGPIHIARAFQKPVFSFFGPTDRSLGYTPFGEDQKKVIVSEIQDLSCRPCHIHGPAECPLKHHRCMRDQTLTFIERNFSQWLQSWK